MLTSALSVKPILSSARVASIIDELVCKPTSSKFILINPYCSEDGDVPTVKLLLPPMFEFFILEFTKVSINVYSDKPRFSKSMFTVP